MGNGGCRECLIAGDARLDDRMSVTTRTARPAHRPANEAWQTKENLTSSKLNLVQSFPPSVQTFSQLDSTINLEPAMPFAKPQLAFDSNSLESLSFSQSAIMNCFEEELPEENTQILKEIFLHNHTVDYNPPKGQNTRQYCLTERLTKPKTKYVNFVTTEEKWGVFTKSELQLQEYNAKCMR